MWLHRGMAVLLVVALSLLLPVGAGEASNDVQGVDAATWATPPVHHEPLYSSRCNIPKLYTKEEWEAYQAQGRTDPVILVGFKDNSYFQSVCTKQNLLQQYGNTSVVLSSANTHSYKKNTLVFREYLEHLVRPRTMDDVAGDTWYFFGNNDYDKSWTNFTQHYHRPDYTYTREPFFSFGIGGSGSGVPFHTHGAVFAEVLHGAKRWFLAPPEVTPRFSPDETSYRWLHLVWPTYSQQEKDLILECTLYPNEVLWIDAQWWHMTLNIGDTVFISTFI
ncbi:hypothetical protein PTSG_04060 [Salpingoeca rosetta]|uniref:JmjC domain-containing protein n=1 Tax=Salpingoeca rosetta (strain ATCC 50818 / BSB-021) TaxID=946362 RepID=F2U7N6_SALR5|nr:uncharacterized protein PTSG_04060 [Salpingoeca rosetta]EGD83453.1 hypothetical protein PTSG_04060 [Salpingoeca rosetta]|eukprot:XP_004994957.1 hypothetical protein PTSG_04060 [Salpingoeca rosetta]